MKIAFALAALLSLSALASAADPSPRDLAQSAIDAARQNDATKAFTQIHAAAKLSTTDPLVIDTAAKLVAWYDTRIYKSQFTPEARKEIEATQLLLLARKEFTAAYKSAAQYYGDLATAQLQSQTGIEFAPSLTPKAARSEANTASELRESPSASSTIPIQPPPQTIYTTDPAVYAVGIPLAPFNYHPPRRDRTTIIDNSPTSIHLDPVFTHSGAPQIFTPSRRTIIDNNPTAIHSIAPGTPSRSSNFDPSPTSIHTDPQFQHSR